MELNLVKNVVSPLDQFEILPWFYFKLLFFDISLTNSNIFLIILVSLIFIFYFFSIEWDQLIPTRYRYVLENLQSFVVLLLKENLGKSMYHFFPFLFVLFLLICGSNLLGMIPFVFTLTSHLAVTFFLASVGFIGLNLLGIIKNGDNFFSLFLPNGAPLVLSPFLILIELISYVARVFSLSIRLFANIMSGHTLLKILAGFGWQMLLGGGFGFLFFLIPTIVVFLVTGLEMAIAFLQAYVFVVLMCIYLNDAIFLH